jgi:hypothetical protein
MVLPARSSGFWKWRILRHREHPLHAGAAGLGVGQRCHALHIAVVLEHPVVAGQAGVQRAVLHIARHLLRTHQHALDLRVVDRREVAAATRIDAPARALKERNRRVLQAALWNSQLQFVAHGLGFLCETCLLTLRPFACRLLSYPNQCNRFGKAAHRALVAHQAIAFDLYAEQQRVVVAVGRGGDYEQRLPLVSPFIHSLLRVRDQKVTKPVSSVFW